MSEARQAVERLVSRLQIEIGEATLCGIMTAVAEELGGLRITIPTLADLERQERDRRIRASLTGNNYEEVAIRFGVSVRQVRRIQMEE